MNFSEIRDYVKQLIKATFPNLSALKEFSITPYGKILFKGYPISFYGFEKATIQVVSSLPVPSESLYGVIYKCNGTLYRCDREDFTVNIHRWKRPLNSVNWLYVYTFGEPYDGCPMYSDEICYTLWGYMGAMQLDQHTVLPRKTRPVWTKINAESDMAVISDNITNTGYTWSSQKISTEIATRAKIDDTTTASTTTWSSQKVTDYVTSKAEIWSGTKSQYDAASSNIANGMFVIITDEPVIEYPAPATATASATPTMDAPTVEMTASDIPMADNININEVTDTVEAEVSNTEMNIENEIPADEIVAETEMTNESEDEISVSKLNIKKDEVN